MKLKSICRTKITHLLKRILKLEHSDLNGNQIDVDSDQDVQQVGKKLLLNFLSNQFEDDSSYLKSLKVQIFPIA